MKKGINFYTLMTLAALVLIAGPVATSNMIFGYILGDAPCTSCWALRINMILIVTTVLFIVRYGLKIKYIALIILVSAYGIWNAFWHLGAYAQLDIGQGQALAILGIRTQMWAGIVFWGVLVILGIILMISAVRREDILADLNKQTKRHLGKFAKFTFVIFFIVVASNAVQAIIAVGPPPFTGHDSPSRFTFHMKYNSWSSVLPNAFSASSMRGAFGVASPDLPAKQASYFKFNHNSSESPFEKSKALKIASERDIPLALNGAVNGMRYSKSRNGFVLITDKWGVYFTDKDFKKIDAHFVLDNFYFPFMTELAGVDFLSDDTVKVMTTNKAYSVIKFDPKNADEVKNFAQFKFGGDKFIALDRGMFRTVRANTNYISSFISLGDYSYAISVPSNLKNSFLVIKQLNEDGLLSAEYTPKLSDNITLKAGRNLDELYITGLAKKDGKLYAVSKNYNLIVVINPKTEMIEDIYSYPETISNVRGIDFIDNSIYLESYQGGKNMLYELK